MFCNCKELVSHHEVALGQIFFQILWFTSVVIIPAVFYTCIALIYHQKYNLSN